MNKFLTTTALTLVLLGGNAYAANMAPMTMYEQQATDIQASDFIGMRIYATESEIATDKVVAADANKDWDDIGEVNDVILSRDGAVKAVILGVGGFLGIGEKDVAIPMESVKFVKDGDEADDYFLVVNANKQMLTDAPAYEAPAEKGDATTTTKTDAGMTAPAASADGTAMVRPDVKRDGYRDAETTELTSENLTGAKVYGAKDEDIGEVEKLILNDDGSVKQLVMDIGGFLGMGEHRIAVDLSEVAIMRDEKGDDVRVYIDSTEETLKAQPAYDEG
ncbi:PRC-barrel domain-containing protein [Rhizobium halophytocola]|uniref:Sporulation protein YlmC with PRC-barrel domain n=1 Tax=Rhizobium halophytocola TaxID=735519 RepID=A0ABS4E685_9HYPH|nr:PRC-barrel domain-containing protein [Rhizobium halophytocola]MBP1853458.1 sporulation protein YlmC with PRC-barrel domain [Rhizobium halophytocola]